MTALTPPLADRQSALAYSIFSLHRLALAYADKVNKASVYRHDRLSVHRDPRLRGELFIMERASKELAYRFAYIRAKLESLDMSDETDYATYLAMVGTGYVEANALDLTKTFPACIGTHGSFPTGGNLTDDDLVEYAYETISHDIHDAFSAEVEELIGSDIRFLGTTIISVPQDKVDVINMLRRRRDAMLGLSSYPANPYERWRWGHDTRLRSLSMIPKTGNTVPFTPAFASGTLLYSMGHRGNQVHRVDAVAEDPQATVTISKEDRRVVVRVEAENGIDTADYIIASNADAKLESLAIRTGNTARDLTPAFDAAVLAYQSPAGIPLGALSVDATPAAAGAVDAIAWKPQKDSSATSIEITVTAPDGVTTARTVITQASS